MCKNDCQQCLLSAVYQNCSFKFTFVKCPENSHACYIFMPCCLHSGCLLFSAKAASFISCRWTGMCHRKCRWLGPILQKPSKPSWNAGNTQQKSEVLQICISFPPIRLQRHDRLGSMCHLILNVALTALPPISVCRNWNRCKEYSSTAW